MPKFGARACLPSHQFCILCCVSFIIRLSVNLEAGDDLDFSD
jgi:hypothetical protein